MDAIKYYAGELVGFIRSIPAMESRLRAKDPLTYWLTRASLVVSFIALVLAFIVLLAGQ